MKVLVFGGSGFLGSHVADSLTEAGHDVTIFDIHESPYLKQGQEMVIGDILSQQSIEDAVEGMDAVMHFAGIADLDEATSNPQKTVMLNILGTVNILDACNRFGINHFVYASTIYAHSEKGGFYRCSKQSAELYVEEYSRKYGLEYTILRYGTLYGPRSDERNSIFRYAKQALEEKRIIVGGSGEEIREYIHVKDAADLSVKILSKDYYNKHIILSGHHSLRVKDLMNMISEILGGDVAIAYLNRHSEAHYNITPYYFRPNYSFKMEGNCYRDMGYGLVETIQEVHEKSTEAKVSHFSADSL